MSSAQKHESGTLSLPRRRGGARRVLRAGLGAALGTLAARVATEVVLRVADPDGISFKVEGTDYLLNALADVNSHPLVYRQGVPDLERGRYVLNNYGFRGPDFVPEKPEGTKRILCIGDSATACMGVDEDETWPSLLQNWLQEHAQADRRYEVLNLGVPGFNTVGELGLLLEPGLSLAPDAVILTVVYNDDEIQPGNARFYELFPEYADGVADKLPRPQSYARDTWKYPAWKAANALLPYTVNYVRHLVQRRGSDGGPMPDRDVAANRAAGPVDFRNALDRFAATCRERGIDLFLVYCGSLEDAWSGVPAVVHAARAADVPLVHFPRNHVQGPELWNSAADPHLNAKGNRVFAGRVLADIGERLK